MTKEQWRMVQFGAAVVAVLGMVWLVIGATTLVFITVGVVVLACLGTYKYAGDKYGGLLAQELHRD